MLNITVIDCSHKDRPSLSFQASEVISSSMGTLILSPRRATSHDHSVNSVYGLCRDIRQGFDLNLSHDWVVKVHG